VFEEGTRRAPCTGHVSYLDNTQVQRCVACSSYVLGRRPLVVQRPGPRAAAPNLPQANKTEQLRLLSTETAGHACNRRKNRRNAHTRKRATPSSQIQGYMHSLVVAKALQDVSASLQGVLGRSSLYMLLQPGWHASGALIAAVLILFLRFDEALYTWSTSCTHPWQPARRAVPQGETQEGYRLAKQLGNDIPLCQTKVTPSQGGSNGGSGGGSERQW